MAECHLAACREAGLPVVAIASRTLDRAEAAAARRGIANVSATQDDLIANPSVEILDIAYPPDQQAALIGRALSMPHIRGTLGQKPPTRSLADAIALRNDAASGEVLSLNQNTRCDQSMRVPRQILDRGDRRCIVFARIDRHAVPHWQRFLQGCDRLTLANTSVHPPDVLRFLFGKVSEITTQARRDPRTVFPHADGITVPTLRFASGVLVPSLEDVWSGR